ncbi:MAG: hypothetical protein HC869_19205 [Rhodospirillales bacterium]|nr:hypothetical protein [Rhodospirillales bacterium]
MRRLRQFMRDCRGNVAITFSLAAVPMMIGVGAALDMVNANRVETLMQGAADAAALGGELSDKTNEDELRQIAVDYLNANGVTNAVQTIAEDANGRNRRRRLRRHSQRQDPDALHVARRHHRNRSRCLCRSRARRHGARTRHGARQYRFDVAGGKARCA